MMNAALSPDSPADAVLAAVAKRLLGDPLKGLSQLVFSDLSEVERDALFALAKHLRSDPAHLLETNEGRTRILYSIVETLGSRALAGAKAEAIASRLGEQGFLRPSDYDVAFGDIIQAFEKLGSTRNHVLQVVRNPDAVQHLVPPRDDHEYPAISLMAKRIQTRSHSFVALVEATRSGKQLNFQAIWRVPERLVLTAREMDLVSLLRAFVHEFGLLVQIPSRPPTKFIYYDAVPLEPEQRARQNFFVVHNDAKRPFHASTAIRISSLNVLEVSLAYAIDTARYRASF